MPATPTSQFPAVLRWVATVIAAVVAVTASALVVSGGRATAAEAAPTVWTWGSEASLSGSDQTTPAEVSGLPQLVSVSTGGYGRSSTGLTSGGVVWAWGANHYGERGDGTAQPWSSTSVDAPSRVPGLTGVVQIDSERSLEAAVTSAGTVSVWGDDADPDPTKTLSPTRVGGLSNVRSIAVFGLLPDITWAWWTSSSPRQPAPGTTSASSGVATSSTH